MIASLQQQGYHVIVNGTGTTPLDRETVLALRPRQSYSRTDSGVSGAGNDLITTVTGKTVYIDVR